MFRYLNPLQVGPQILRGWFLSTLVVCHWAYIHAWDHP